MKTKKNKSILMKNHKFTKKSCVYHYKQITPQTLLNLFDKKNVAIVNVLDDNVFLNKKNINGDNCYGKDFINQTCNKLNSYEVIILYCKLYNCIKIMLKI